LAGTEILVGRVMRVPDFFLVLGIIEGEQQGMHLTQDLFIRNGAPPDTIFKGLDLFVCFHA
jgi:hypothetical protein